MKATKKTTVRTVLADLIDRDIPKKSKLKWFSLALNTAPIWDTFLCFIRILLRCYAILEFLWRLIFSARLRHQLKMYWEAKKIQCQPTSDFLASPTVGQLITYLELLHDKYVTGRLHKRYRDSCTEYEEAENFTKVFGLSLEQVSDLSILVARISSSLTTACTRVIEAELGGFHHEMQNALSTAQIMATKVVQFKLWPRESKFTTWMRECHRGVIEARFVLTYFFCKIRKEELPYPKKAATADSASSGTSDGDSKLVQASSEG